MSCRQDDGGGRTTVGLSCTVRFNVQPGRPNSAAPNEHIETNSSTDRRLLYKF